MFPSSPLVERAQTREASLRLERALESLESTKPSTRLAGVFTLESLARENASLGESLVDVLSALVRRRAGSLSARIDEEVQAALTVLGRASRSGAGWQRPLDLHGIALREAYLPLANLENAWLYDCDLEAALLCGANLRGAWLWRANLKRANFDDADLRGADLSGALNLTKEQIARAQFDEHTRWPEWN